MRRNLEKSEILISWVFGIDPCNHLEIIIHHILHDETLSQDSGKTWRKTWPNLENTCQSMIWFCLFVWVFHVCCTNEHFIGGLLSVFEITEREREKSYLDTNPLFATNATRFWHIPIDSIMKKCTLSTDCWRKTWQWEWVQSKIFHFASLFTIHR